MALVAGDIVLVRMKALGQDHRIADKWEQGPHVVISQMCYQPVLKIQPRNAKNQEGIRVLHWNISTQSSQHKMMSKIQQQSLL